MLSRQMIASTLVFMSKVIAAGTMGDFNSASVCIPGSRIIPCATYAWEVSAYGLYLKPSYGRKLIYLNTINNELLARQITKEVTDWTGGFALAAAYHFNTGSDLAMNWYHFDQKNTKSTDLTILPFNLPTTINYTFEPTWDAIKLEFGQIIDYGNNKSFRLTGGLQYTRLASAININLPPITLKQTLRYLSAEGSIKFHGVGPQIGLDFYSNFSTNVGIYANAAFTVLFGDGQFQQTGFINNVALTYKSGAKALIIPEFESKVGLQFIYPMKQSYFSLNTGYMLVDFLSGIKSFSPRGITNLFSLNGAYLGVKWVDGL